MEEAEHKRRRKLPMYQEHYNALFSMDFVETKYPHDDTMKALGSLRMWSWSQEHALGQVFSHRMESYKELTCSLDLFGFTMEKGTMELKEKMNSKGFGLQSLMGTLPQGPRLLRSGAQCLRYVHKALANTFFARKALGQSMREVKLLDMGIKPIISRTRMGRRSEEIGHAGNSCLSLTALSYKTQLTTLGIKRKKA
ncbi:unnamed protein product [Microthlaspi erraticum]|uniref:Arabidopsis retrotransposon Orf1 C-terminal domain-containing protein n=1 Tax=Microthlaspi erraticum TaxID=1685480 RepID=A0A6D2IY90_9BRAS|nr:unnamed protein product [Microthlaspi erraticum]